MTIAEIFERYGYDPDDPVRGLDIPDRLLHDLAETRYLEPYEVRSVSRRHVRPLSPRELEALEFLATGCVYKEIAVLMGESLETVKTVLQSAYAKLAARNGTHAVVLAIAQGLIPRRETA